MTSWVACGTGCVKFLAPIDCGLESLRECEGCIRHGQCSRAEEDGRVRTEPRRHRSVIRQHENVRGVRQGERCDSKNTQYDDVEPIPRHAAFGAGELLQLTVVANFDDRDDHKQRNHEKVLNSGGGMHGVQLQYVNVGSHSHIFSGLS